MASLFGNTIIQTAEEKSSLDNAVNKIIDKTYNTDLNAFYRAFVANNVDPLKLGRVQIRIPSIHGTANTTIQTLTDSLPWASPGIWSCTGNDMGQYLVPEVGTVVFVTFEQGDQTKPIYFGGISNQIGDTTKYIVNPKDINKGESYEVNTNDYPEDLKSIYDKMLFKSAKGNEVVSSDLDGKEYMYLVDASGQSIEMENFGPYLKRRGSMLGFSGKPRMKLSTNRGSDMVLTNESEIMTTRTLKGQLDDIKILNKTDDLSDINTSLDKLLRDKFKDFGRYSYNKDDKVFNLDVKLNDILDLTTTTDKVYNYEVKMFNEFELISGLYLQVSLVERDEYTTRALISYRNTNLLDVELAESFMIYFADLGKINPYLVDIDSGVALIIPSNSEGNFYATIWGSDLYDYNETWGFNYRKEFRFIVDTAKIPDSNTFEFRLFDLDTIDRNCFIETIDWGDGTVDTYIEPTGSSKVYSHTYNKVSSYTVKFIASQDIFKLRYDKIINSLGIVSIESPLPLNIDDSGNIKEPHVVSFGYSSYTGEGTLEHINKYIFRNYLLQGDFISLYEAFANCEELKEIPSKLLEGFNSIADLEEIFYHCKSLKTVPDDLFNDKDLSSCTRLDNMFRRCVSLEYIPDFLFDNETLINVTRVSYMFCECTNLIKIPQVLLKHMINLQYADYMFYNCISLSYIPSDLFINNKNIKTLVSSFNSCSGLREIPRYLFRYNKKISSMSGTFVGCSRIEFIYSDLFYDLKSLKYLQNTFAGCTSLGHIEYTGRGLLSCIHTAESLSVDKMFYNCNSLVIKEKDLIDYNLDKIFPYISSWKEFLYRKSFTGTGVSTIPPLWNFPYGGYGSNAFGGDGNNSSTITNYNEIPLLWRIP